MRNLLHRRPGTLPRFVASGAATALLYLALGTGLIAAGLRPFIAGLVAYAAAFAAGYALQRNWTFRARHAHGRALPRYLALQTLCALLAAGVAEAVSVTGAPALAAGAASTAAAGGVSYLASLLWVFPASAALAPRSPPT
jgi:putative flippase GtrA